MSLTTASSRRLQRQGRNLLPDFDGALVVGLEEVVGAVVLDGLPAVLPHVKDYNSAEMGKKNKTKTNKQ